ncbi:MAG: hypothetical protein WCK49_09740, partial [Myxococcaceae bacterium]
MKNRILFYFMTTAFVFLSVNCGKNTDGLSRVEQTLSGVVNLGSPLSGSTVTAYMFRHAERGEVLGAATTDELGAYKIEHHHPYRGPVLLVAVNGSFVDPATKMQMFMPEKLTLVSGISDSNVGTVANINAASTLSAMWFDVPETKTGFVHWSGKDENIAVESVLIQLSGHFDRNASRFNYLTISPWDPSKEKLGPSENRVLLYLFHAGLSQMAKDLSKASGQEPGAIRSFDLIYALSLDAKDGIFDGKQKQVQLYVDKGNQIPLDSYFMRHKLAASIQLYINGLTEAKVDLGFDGKSFSAPGGFYETISMDSFSWFFNKDHAPIPFDTDAPEIKMVFLGKHANEISGKMLSGDVVIEARATDHVSGLKSFKIIEPVNVEPTTQEDGRLTYVVTPSMIPNADQALKACGFSYGDLYHGVGNIEEHAEAFCLCVEARDALDNVSHRVRCVRRPNPTVRIDHSAIGVAFGAAAFLNQDRTQVKGELVGGYNLLTCGWQVFTLDDATKIGDIELPWGRGLIQGNKCEIDSLLSKDLLPDGNYKVRLVGSDLIGEKVDCSDSRSCQDQFVVYQTPPVLEITSPEAEIRTNASKVAVRGSVRSGIAIRDVYAEVQQGLWHSSTSGRQIYGDVLDGKWSVVLDPLAEQGIYTYVIHAIDIYGNHSQLAPRLIVIDRTPPTIKGHREGVAQGSYAQEHSTVSVFRDGTPGLPQFQFKSNGTQTRIPWDNIPVLYRWASQLNDEKAPSYEIQVADESGMKEVRWVHGTKCLPIEKAKNIAELIDGKAILNLTALTAEDKLETAIDENSPRCISVWAVDTAGNTQNQQISFRWRTVAPPIVVDFNS